VFAYSTTWLATFAVFGKGGGSCRLHGDFYLVLT